MIRFDGTRFYRGDDNTPLDIRVSCKGTRWFFRLPNGKLLASGLTPAQFVREFWYQDMEQI